MQMWRAYFPNATLYGYEFNPAILEAAKQHGLANTHYLPINIADPQSIAEGLSAPGKPFDVILDDSTHLFDHEINFVKVALKFVRPGGILIVEDIFRPWDEGRFTEALRPYFQFFSSATFIETNHENRSSEGTVEPYYDNDKLLVLFRNETAYAMA
jgi:predicted O-methyltransferase YrrM